MVMMANQANQTQVVANPVPTHRISVRIDDQVFQGIVQFATDRGLDVNEAVKWVLGDFVHHNVRPYMATPAPVPVAAMSRSFSAGPSNLDKFMNVLGVYMQQVLATKPILCKDPTCGTTLTIADIVLNECPKCHKKIV